MNAELLAILEFWEKEKGISKDVLLTAVQESLMAAAKKAVGPARELRVTIDPRSGDISAWAKLIVADRVVSSIPLPAFDPYRDYFITSRMSAWLFLLYQDIPWARFGEAAAWLVGFGLTGFLVGWIAFERRDVKS